MAEQKELTYIIVDVRDRLERGDAISVLEFLTRQAGSEIVFATQPADLDIYEGAALDAAQQPAVHQSGSAREDCLLHNALRAWRSKSPATNSKRANCSTSFLIGIHHRPG
jgi:hypothetical protein